jgi:hypothetical protein
MYEGTRQGGKYYLRPINPDHSHKLYPITKKDFYERWRRNGASEKDIKSTLSHKRDFRVL